MSESASHAYPQPGAELDGLQRAATAAAVLGVVGLVAGYVTSPDQFFRGYLIGYLYWLGIALGSLAFMMIHHLSGGAWGLMIRRPLEAAASTIPAMGVLFVPIIIGIPSLYEWSDAGKVATDAIIAHRAPYLNPTFFTLRAIGYFVIWSGLALTLIRWSRRQDRETPPPGADLRFRHVSGPGVLIYGLTISFASFDWVMSLDPHWYSTIFGLLYMVGQGLSAMAFIICVTFLLTRVEPLSHLVTAKNVSDLGKLLLAFTMLWAYLSYSQFLITWAANLPEEIPYYLRRFDHGWQWVSVLLVVGHFALPFSMLLSRDRKNKVHRLAVVGIIVLVMRFVDHDWLIRPQFQAEFGLPMWTSLAAWLGVGGIWLSLFVRQLRGHAVLPVNDPYLKEALADGH